MSGGAFSFSLSKIVATLCSRRLISAIALVACSAFVSSCDVFVKSQFENYCKANIPPLLQRKIATKGIEFRGDFGLYYYTSWSGFAEFVEFSAADIGSQSPSYSEFKEPQLLTSAKYRMTMFDDWKPECREYWKYLKAPELLDEALFRAQEDFMRETPLARCQGIFPIESFKAEYIVTRIDNPNYGRILGRKIYARIFRISDRTRGDIVGELHAYYISSPDFYQGLAELPQGYQCTSIEGNTRINTDDLAAIFAPIDRP